MLKNIVCFTLQKVKYITQKTKQKAQKSVDLRASENYLHFRNNLTDNFLGLRLIRRILAFLSGPSENIREARGFLSQQQPERFVLRLLLKQKDVCLVLTLLGLSKSLGISFPISLVSCSLVLQIFLKTAYHIIQG
jgi:hypothetical protein